MLLCIKCHGIPVIYSDSGLKEIIIKEHYSKQVLQSSNNPRKPCWILSIARHSVILKTYMTMHPLWTLLGLLGLACSFLVHEYFFLTDKLSGELQAKALPPPSPTSVYCPSPTLSPTRQGTGSQSTHSSVP